MGPNIFSHKINPHNTLDKMCLYAWLCIHVYVCMHREKRGKEQQTKINTTLLKIWMRVHTIYTYKYKIYKDQRSSWTINSNRTFIFLHVYTCSHKEYIIHTYKELYSYIYIYIYIHAHTKNICRDQRFSPTINFNGTLTYTNPGIKKR